MHVNFSPFLLEWIFHHLCLNRFLTIFVLFFSHSRCHVVDDQHFSSAFHFHLISSSSTLCVCVCVCERGLYGVWRDEYCLCVACIIVCVCAPTDVLCAGMRDRELYG